MPCSQAGEIVPSPLGREGGGVFLLLPSPSLPIFPFIRINDGRQAHWLLAEGKEYAAVLLSCRESILPIWFNGPRGRRLWSGIQPSPSEFSAVGYLVALCTALLEPDVAICREISLRCRVIADGMLRSLEADTGKGLILGWESGRSRQGARCRLNRRET